MINNLRMLVLVLLAGTLLPCLVQAQSNDNPIESGRKALTRENPFPWYDQQADELRRIPLDTEWIERMKERMESMEGLEERLKEWMENVEQDFDPSDLPSPDMSDLEGALDDFDSEAFRERFEDYMRRLAENNADREANPNDRMNPGGRTNNGGSGDPFRGDSEMRRGGGGRSNSSSGSPDRFNPPDLGFIGGGAEFAKALFYIVLGIVALALIGLIIWAIMNREKTKKDPGVEMEGSVVTDDQRIEELPFQLDSAYKDLLERARECYQNGDFDQAIIYLFSYELIQLDKAQLIKLTRGKTNHQYLREVQPNASLKSRLSTTVRAFEDVFFGNKELSQQRFEECWREVSSFQQLTTSPAPMGYA
ncbi:MAG: hypothetical protein CMJ79_08475 [Planctomycetaceae bacterium]|jgi:hypothetical protein|nr:hypothetical protein [Planctomycetaceae bacterium]|tara:strand:- start:41489 stop:42580 length:1092 start_codon:yes stop_codon:yes gene_type:complete